MIDGFFESLKGNDANLLSKELIKEYYKMELDYRKFLYEWIEKLGGEEFEVFKNKMVSIQPKVKMISGKCKN